MKNAYSLKALLPSSPVMKINCRFPSKCPTRKRLKNKPVNAIQYFLAIDDDKIADLLIFTYVLIENICTNLRVRTNQMRFGSYLD
jgi:hypothetical protein